MYNYMRIAPERGLTLILFMKSIASPNLTGDFFGGVASSSLGRVITYSFGKKALNPRIRSLCPFNNSFTLVMTLAISILETKNNVK